MNQFELEKKTRNLLYVIVTTLVFEGLVRKVLPKGVGMVIFFLKDFFCLMGFFYLSKNNANVNKIKEIVVRYKVLLICFFPLIVRTGFLDPALAFFGLKQYMLYIVVAILVPIAFPPDKSLLFQKFALYLSVLIIPTTIIAILQNQLPSTHWLNLSVDGETLENFAAGGKLRVSSTFSFTGQYCWFINEATGFLFVAIYMPFIQDASFKRNVLNISLGILLMIGAFITGGRTAVLGSGVCLIIGSVLCGSRYPSLFIAKALGGVALFIVLLGVLKEVRPDYFKAYETRSEETSSTTNETNVGGNADVTDRVLDNFTGWSKWVYKNGILSFCIGNGIGIQSNGAGKISKYAASITDAGETTEGDMETVVWEGGVYLLVVWFGFRIWFITYCYKLWSTMKNSKYVLGSAFLFANIFIFGTTSFISRQPPLSIWFFLCIGSVIAIGGFDKYESNKKISINNL